MGTERTDFIVGLVCLAKLVLQKKKVELDIYETHMIWELKISMLALIDPNNPASYLVPMVFPLI